VRRLEDDPDIERAGWVMRRRDEQAKVKALTRPQPRRGRCEVCGFTFRARSERAAADAIVDHCTKKHRTLRELNFIDPSSVVRH